MRLGTFVIVFVYRTTYLCYSIEHRAYALYVIEASNLYTQTCALTMCNKMHGAIV